jgi:hypothetical protein
LKPRRDQRCCGEVKVAEMEQANWAVGRLRFWCLLDYPHGLCRDLCSTVFNLRLQSPDPRRKARAPLAGLGCALRQIVSGFADRALNIFVAAGYAFADGFLFNAFAARACYRHVLSNLYTVKPQMFLHEGDEELLLRRRRSRTEVHVHSSEAAGPAHLI